MCNVACLQFCESKLKREEVEGKRVLEVGSRNINGSFREMVNKYNPSLYLGVDIDAGDGVDELCSIYNLVSEYGIESFDVVICTEVLEHVENWISAISNLKNILKPNGVMLLTTRSKGFGYHEFPLDCWRYEIEDIEVLFSDCIIEENEKDTFDIGVLVKLRKPIDFVEIENLDYELYSMAK
jgi:SAM-dependent methyltransferase